MGAKPRIKLAQIERWLVSKGSRINGDFADFWSGRWESNPRPKLGKLLYCHCTTPALDLTLANLRGACKNSSSRIRARVSLCVGRTDILVCPLSGETLARGGWLGVQGLARIYRETG